MFALALFVLASSGRGNHSPKENECEHARMTRVGAVVVKNIRNDLNFQGFTIETYDFTS